MTDNRMNYDEQSQMEISARWKPLVEAAGMFSSALKPGNIFMLATEIRRDSVVQARVRSGKWDYKPMPQYPAMVSTDYIALLEEMSGPEKDALSARICAKYPNAVVVK
jgi:hypothetical protein